MADSDGIRENVMHLETSLLSDGDKKLPLLLLEAGRTGEYHIFYGMV